MQCTLPGQDFNIHCCEGGLRHPPAMWSSFVIWSAIIKYGFGSAPSCVPYDEITLVSNVTNSQRETNQLLVEGIAGPLRQTQASALVNSSLKDAQILRDRFATFVGKSSVTGFDWRSVNEVLFEKTLRTSWSFPCPQSKTCTAYQVVGVCGELRFGTSAVRSLLTRSSVGSNYVIPAKQSQSYQCKNGEHFHSEYYCDNEVDCSDGSDEDWEMCASFKDPFPVHQAVCKPHELKCSSDGACYQQYAACNGHVWCLDASDESHRACDLSKVSPATIESYAWLPGFWEAKSNYFPPYLLNSSVDIQQQTPAYLCRHRTDLSWFMGLLRYNSVFENYFCSYFSHDSSSEGTLLNELPLNSNYEVLLEPSLDGRDKLEWVRNGKGNIYDGSIIGGLSYDYELYFMCRENVAYAIQNKTSSALSHGHLFLSMKRCQISYLPTADTPTTSAYDGYYVLRDPNFT